MHGGGGREYNDYNDMEYIRTTKIIKTGTSLCVVIPKEILRAVCFERGDQVAFGIYNMDTIAIRKISPGELTIVKPKEI